MSLIGCFLLENIAQSYEDDQRKAYEAAKKMGTFTNSNCNTFDQSTVELVGSTSSVLDPSNWTNNYDSNVDDDDNENDVDIPGVRRS